MSRPHGIDVSKWQHPFSLHGYDFVIIRASYGGAVDPALEGWVLKAKQAGIPFGLYHFAYNSPSAEAQARVFVNAASGTGATRLGNIGLIVDCEGELRPEMARAIIREVRQDLRHDDRPRGRVGLYSGGWIKSHGGGTMGAEWGWLAQWGPTPVRPAGWSRHFTRFWQYASDTLDRDLFRGSHRRFARWLSRDSRKG